VVAPPPNNARPPSMLPAAYGLPLEIEGSLVSLTEPGLRPLHSRRRADVEVLHLLAVGQQLYALSLQLLDAQALRFFLRSSSTSSHLLFFGSPTLLDNLYHRAAAGSSPKKGDFSPIFGMREASKIECATYKVLPQETHL
jgi:hypothetical protein